MHATATTTTTPPIASRSSLVPATPNRVWSRLGGGAIALGGTLLLTATVIEVALRDDAAGPMLPVFAVLFLASAAVLALAMLPLALGSTGADGITGTRTLGKVALLCFGAVFVLNQTLYFGATYGAPAGTDLSAVAWLPVVLNAAQFVLLLTASIAVVRAGVTTGAARWALLAMTVVTIALISSCVAQIVVGGVLLSARSSASAGTV
jgi:hypothetical protein